MDTNEKLARKIEDLSHEASYGSSPHEKIKAIHKLGGIGTPQALNGIINALGRFCCDSGYEMEINAAVNTIREMGDATIDTLTNRIDDVGASMALAMIADPRTSSSLVAIVTSTTIHSFKIKCVAAKSLANINYTPAREPILYLLRDILKERYELLKRASEAIASGWHEGMRGIGRYAEDLRMIPHATAALASLCIPDTDVLIKGLDSADVWTRIAAASVLCLVKDRRAVDTLIKMIGSGSSKIPERSEATKALGFQSDLKAVEPLIDALRAGEDAASESLMNVTGKSFIFGNRNWKKWVSWWQLNKDRMLGNAER